MLEEIIKNKIIEVETLKKTQNNSLDDILSMNIPRKNFTKSLTEKINSGKNAIIAELKRCSPSKGYLDKNLNIKEMAQTYQDSGAACISVLTDSKYFKGSNEDLKLVKKSINLPILRKDFIIDETQIIESKLIGADCILLIDDITKAIELCPENSQYLTVRSEIYLAILMPDLALEDIEKAAALNPDDPNILSVLESAERLDIDVSSGTHFT